MKGAHKKSRYSQAIGQLEGSRGSIALEVDGETVELTNLDKVLWPAEGALRPYTRRDHMRYLLRMAPYLLPHAKDRPLTLIRQPEGVRGRRFVQFHWEQRLPKYVDSVSIFSEKRGHAEDYLVCNNTPTLLWLAHVGCLELHAWHSRAEKAGKGCAPDYAASLDGLEASALDRPDYIVLDIDPYIYSGAEAKGEQPEFNAPAFDKAKQVALRVKELLDAMKLESLVKTSGKTGLHVLVPMTRSLTYDAARAFAETLGRHVMRELPDLITMDQKVVNRTGKIFFDAGMNARVKTLTVPYSVRGLAGAPVSMPFAWKDLAEATPLRYTMENAADLVERKGDIWSGITATKQNIARVLSRQ